MSKKKEKTKETNLWPRKRQTDLFYVNYHRAEMAEVGNLKTTKTRTQESIQ